MSNVRNRFQAVRERFQCQGESLTEQSHSNECDINSILLRARKTGYVPQYQGGVFDDFSSVEDYTATRNRIEQAQKAFDSLPADLREKFKNHPANLLEFLSNPGNRAEAEKLKLVKQTEAAIEPKKDENKPIATNDVVK